MTRVKPMRKILTAAEPDIMIHVVRLIVLYEDLKLEIGLMLVPPSKALDEVSEHYRRAYLLRRLFTTFLEIDSALLQLNAHSEFKQALQRFPVQQLEAWDTAIKFFAKKKSLIKDRRNAYGGHFQANVAKYVLSLVEDADESVGALEIKIDDDGAHHYVFQFAESLVNVGLFFDRGKQDQAEFMTESMELVTDAIRHAAMAVQSLADHYILPTFGW